MNRRSIGSSSGWLVRLCAELGIERRHAARARAALAGRQRDGDVRLAALETVEVLTDSCCEEGDHEAEEDVAGWLVAEADGEVGPLVAGWSRLVRARRHLAARAEGDRRSALAAVRDACEAAIDEIGAACRGGGLDARQERATLDPLACTLAEVERELGVPLSPAAADAERRLQARLARGPASLPFRERHGRGVRAVEARDGEAWWHERFTERFGAAPPDGWWSDGAGDAMPGRLAPDRVGDGWFDQADEVAFLVEMEDRYRAEMALPPRGGGLVSQAHLGRCLEAVLPGREVIREARAGWLGAQRLDLYVPSLALAVEYQGEQHYLPLPHWGGEAGLAARRELDERKRDACLRAGVRLIEWRYDEPVSVEEVRRRLERTGLLEIAEEAPGYVPPVARNARNVAT